MGFRPLVWPARLSPLAIHCSKRINPLPSVDPAYRHRPKIARPSGALHWGNAQLKCYDLAEDSLPVIPATAKQAAAYLATLPSPDATAGFVILHRCGDSFHFLLLHLWRGNNEIWQAVHYADPPEAGFAPFAPAYPGLGQPRPTLCVWELGIAAHEALAWQRYLFSAREPEDFAAWQADRLTAKV